MTSKRTPHILKPTKGNARPSSIIFLDTETNQEKRDDKSTKHTLRLGYSEHWRYTPDRGFYRQSHIEIYNIKSFWNWLDKQIRLKSTTHLVAHNIIFDLSVMHGYRELYRREWELESLYSKAVTSIFRWKQGDRRLIGMDNMNLFQGKLEKWGELFNIPKGRVDFDNVNDDDLMTYCKRDVEIMVKSWQAWFEFLDKHDLGNFKVTIGSTALSAWRHKYMRHKVHIHDNDDALTLERESYHGGRTECFWTGEQSGKNFYYMDVNNMYGYILANHDFPCGLWNYTDKPTSSKLLKKLERQAVTAKVLIETNEPVFPVMNGNITVYPVGQFITTLTTPELILAIEKGWYRDVYEMAWYLKAPLFRDYILDFHGLRMEYRHAGNSGYEQIAKMMMNSLYGKFGQSGFDQRRIGNAKIDDTWSQVVVNAQTHKVSRMFALAGGVYDESKEGESANSFPAIAAHVTAYARLYLYSLFSKAGRNHVYYCDTDSLIVDQTGHNNLKDLIDPDRLGYLKVEHKSRSLAIYAPKDYIMGDRVRIKGVMKDAEILDANTVEQSQWQRLGGQIHTGQIDDFIVKRVKKSLHRMIRSGTVLPSGWIEPFELTLPASALPGFALKHPELIE